MVLFYQLSVMDTFILTVISDGYFYFFSFLCWMVLFCQLSVIDASVLSVIIDGYFYFISYL